MIEIRWHGRAQQGVVTVAKILAEAALFEGKYIQAFPDYGPERMGAPLRAYNRISDDSIHTRESVKNPSIVVVVDNTLIEVVDILGGMLEDGIVVVNTNLSSKEIKKQIKGLKERLVWTVNASRISLEEMKRAMPNTPMLGALVGATGVVSLDSIKFCMQKSFAEKFSQKMINANLAALERGYKEVQK